MTGTVKTVMWTDEECATVTVTVTVKTVMWKDDAVHDSDSKVNDVDR